MTTPFPILSEFHTAGVGGVHTMVRTGATISTGACWGWADHGEPADRLVEKWCGPGDAYCKRAASMLATLPPEARVLLFDGFFGQSDRDATIEALNRYDAYANAIGAPIDGIIIDDESHGPDKGSNLADLLYGSGVFNRKETWCACWNVWNGIGTCYNEWGEQAKTHGLIDGQTATVHGYLRDPSIPGLFTTGVSWCYQVNRIIDAAMGAVADGYRIVPLTATALRDHANKPYPAEALPEVERMFRELSRLNPRAWWLFNVTGQQFPPFGQQGQYAYGVLKEKLTANPTMTSQAMLAELGDIVYNQHYAGEWEAIQIDTAATVAAIQGA